MPIGLQRILRITAVVLLIACIATPFVWLVLHLKDMNLEDATVSLAESAPCFSTSRLV
jgi:hypothetical protein